MIRARFFVLVLSLCLIGQSVPIAYGYELATHGAMTYNAYQRSILKDSQFLKDLGIDTQINLNPAEPFGITYYDMSGNAVNERQRQSFEGDIIQELATKQNLDVTPLSLQGWLLRGAIREDDWTGIDIPGCRVIAENPQDDPYPNPPDRPKNHFYDPYYDRALTVLGVALGKKAPDWASGTSDVFNQPNTPETNRRNHFTVLDAREAEYRALTGKNKDNQDVAPTKDDRNNYWTTFFRALGDIVHLVQDMGQPQHTRNDRHSGACVEAITGHASVYEKYLDCRATGGQVEGIDNYQNYYIDTCGSLTYTDYPIPVFTKYSDFFSTRDGTGRGLADYSNRNFFTFGTNLGHNSYPSPVNNRNLYTEVPVTDVAPGNSLATVKLLRGVAADNVTGATDSALLTTESAFDFFLGTARSYSLNSYNYNDMADLLVPRATAYSAGLINYFFRGRIAAEDAHFTDTGISLKIRNTIDPESAPEWNNEYLYAKTSSGNLSTLTVTYEYKDDQNVTHYVTSNTVQMVIDPNDSANDDNVAPGEVSKKTYSFALNIPFVDPGNPQAYKELKYRLVYRGKLGQEDDAVIAAVFQPTSGFLVTPNYVPSDGIGGARMIYRTSAGWRLAPDAGLVAGNVDWKGRYETDPADPTGTAKPTKVLSWHGSRTRYFPDSENCQSAPFNRCKWVSSSGFGREIFENGQVIANAPAEVLGAAITRDIQGKDWLVAICMEGVEDVLYRRPYRKGSDALYDPVNAPNGWKEVGRFDASTLNQGTSRTTHRADRPWFFSGDGRKAQTLRRWWETTSTDFYQKEMRLEININDDITLAMPPQNHDNLAGYVDTYACETNYDQYGAGTGQTTSTSSGEYIIAVDYDKDGNEILAKIRVMGNSVKTTNVTVAHNHLPTEGHSKDVLTGTTQMSGGSYTEELVWKNGSILPTFSDTEAYNATWGSGPQPLNNYFMRTIDRMVRQKHISYFVDLRYNLYSYYYYGDHDQENISGGVINFMENVDEGNEITSGLMTSKIIVNTMNRPPYNSNSSQYHIEREVNCDPFYPNNATYYRYGVSNFGYSWRGGAGLVDSQGNYAISQPTIMNFGYESLNNANYLSGGNFADVIKNAPPDPYYSSISVLY